VLQTFDTIDVTTLISEYPYYIEAIQSRLTAIEYNIGLLLGLYNEGYYPSFNFSLQTLHTRTQKNSFKN